MCGIAFILSDKNYDRCEIALEKMTKSLIHRGPDGTNYKVVAGDNSKLFFGHTRLSILDLSDAASQPMHDPETDSYLIYNGEIYNYLELKNELRRSGITVFSTGDTEILFRLLIHYGEKALPKLNGMFSFVFWHGQKKELIASRDQFGIKPLYYSSHSGYLLIASEIKSIISSALFDFTLNNNSVNSFLTFGSVIRPQTISAQITELQPGSYFKIQKLTDEIKEVRHTFYSPFDSEFKIKDPGEASGLVQTAIERSVDRHLLSDVPVGIFLSGGIDSSYLSIIAAEKREAINLFTVSFSDAQYSELKYAFEVAQMINGNHKITHLSSEDLLNYFNQFVLSLDQPTVDGINTFIISNVAKLNNIKVLISGLGGDEIFGGYTSFRNLNLLNKFKYPISFYTSLMKHFVKEKYLLYDKASLSYKNKNPFQDYILQRAIRWGGNCSPLQNSLVPPTTYMNPAGFEHEFDMNRLDSGYNSISYLETYFYMSNQLLRDSDIFSMANSIELRVPYLDKELIKAAYSIDQSVHYDLFNSKKVLKDLLYKKIPYLDTKRKKMGFTFPWDMWLKNQLKDLILDTLTNKDLYKSVDLDYRNGLRLVENYFSGSRKVSWFQIWSLFILLNWQKTYKLSLG